MPEQTIEDLGKLVKQKYPGQYDDLQDAELGQRVKTKYPQAYSDFADTPLKATQQIMPGAVKAASSLGKFVPSPSTIVSTAGGAAIGGLSESPLLGSATMVAIKNLLDNPQSDKPTPANLLNFGKDVGLNELFGRGFSAVGKIGQEIYKPGSVLPEEMQKLLPFKPTTAQLSNSNVLSLIENAFASKSKQAALLRSAGVIDTTGEDMLRNFTGQSDIELNQPFKQAGVIQKDIEQQFDASKLESNKRGIAASVIARANKQQVPVYSKVESTLQPGTFYMKQTGTRNITGAIIPTNYLQAAQNLLSAVNKSDIPPDPNSPLVSALHNIIQKNQELDANGNIIPKIRDFGDMWETKKAIDDIAYNNPKSQTTFVDKRFQELSKAINQDIDNSLPSWQVQGNVAQRLFNESKTIVAQRNKIFTNSPIEKLVNEETKDVPTINSIIDDPKQLQKSLIAGNLVIPEGSTGFQTNIKYITNNTRKDLQGYELQRLINSSKYTDDKGNVLFDGQKLLERWNDPDKQESYKLLFNQQNRADIEQFFKNVNAVSQKGQLGMSRYWLMRLTGVGLGLSGGLLSGMGTIPGAGLGIVGGTIGFNQLGKLLTNPTFARTAVAAIQGGSLNMPTMVASRIMANVLRNTTITIEYQNGNKVEARINNEGKLALPVGR